MLSNSIKNCRLCNGNKLEKILKLVPTPAGNNFLTEKEKSDLEPKFPLELFFCKDCSHIQLGELVDPSHLFKNYHFVSGTSKVNIDHFENYAEEIISKFNLKKGSFILDIGSNDGTCLKAFKSRGMKVLGVDPADNIAEIANGNGIETICDFFNINLSKKIKKKYGTPDLITSHNVLAHVDDFSGVMKSISNLMSNETIFVFEVGYFKEVFKNLWFDTIYHEHLDYHTVKPLKLFFEKLNMTLFDVEEKDIQGGSIRNYVQLANSKNKIESSVDKLISEESLVGLHNVEKLKIFQSRIERVKQELYKTLLSIKKSKKNIVGYGAPTKSTTLLNFFEIDSSYIDYIVDDNPLKQEKYSPLLHIPIRSSETLFSNPHPDYIIILAWNFADSIIEKIKSKNFNGKYIIPLPNVIIKD
tara:strand:+ start:49154 stop:50395 length:1242 start_codon:yes stop_codon:yes gene_type:complete